MKKVLASHEVERVVYLDFESFLVMGELMSVKKIKFDIDKSLTRKVLDKLIILDINRVECYFMPSDYVHELSKKKVVINFNNDMKFDKDFILLDGAMGTMLQQKGMELEKIELQSIYNFTIEHDYDAVCICDLN